MFKAKFADRRLINMKDEFHVKAWTKHLAVDRKMLEQLVAKVGNSATAVKKELGRA